MRVVHVIESLDPAQGGPPAIALGLAAAQAGLGATATVVALRSRRPRPAPEVDARAADLPGLDGVDVRLLRRRNIAARLTKREPAMEDVVRHADVVHLHGVWEPIVLDAARAAKRRGVRYFVHLHGYLHPWSMRQKALVKRVLLHAVFRRMLDDAASLIVGNRTEEGVIRALGLRAASVVVPNGVFPERIRPHAVTGAFRSRVPDLGEAPFVLFMSRLHAMKGLDHLAAAFDLLAAETSDVRLVVMGPDGGAGRGFEREIRRRRRDDRVHLCPPIYGPEKYTALADAMCFCLPSRREGHSMAVLEALTVGTPVVISEACHFPEVAEVGAGIVVPLEPRVIAAALGRIAGDEALREGMSRAARRLIDERYTLPLVAARMLEAYAAR